MPETKAPARVKRVASGIMTGILVSLVLFDFLYFYSSYLTEKPHLEMVRESAPEQPKKVAPVPPVLVAPKPEPQPQPAAPAPEEVKPAPPSPPPVAPTNAAPVPASPVVINHGDLGDAKSRQGDWDGAIAEYTEALQVDPKQADILNKRGFAHESKNDLDGALADYNQALELDPKLAEGYYNRGQVKLAKGDMDGALADYTQALELNPKYAQASCNRGLARQTKGDLDGALADYDQALALDPKIAIAYYYRGLVKEQKNDLSGAIQDYDAAVAQDPKNAQAYYNRAVARQAQGGMDQALADFRQYVQLTPKDRYADYAHLYVWVIRSLQNQQKEADQELVASLGNWNAPPTEMASQIAGFLLGQRGEADVLAAAIVPDSTKDQGFHCEAWYFAGIKRLLAGDRVTAEKYLSKCLATEKKNYCEYILAQAQLKTLEQGPATTPTPAPNPDGLSPVK